MGFIFFFFFASKHPPPLHLFSFHFINPQYFFPSCFIPPFCHSLANKKGGERNIQKFWAKKKKKNGEFAGQFVFVLLLLLLLRRRRRRRKGWKASLTWLSSRRSRAGWRRTPGRSRRTAKRKRRGALLRA